ncbi:class I SAM-dependent methyltransferase [Mycobacterium riyadhense]|uniref:SAM-dependent methyltransferase n=1 Tax=Mycobacterium riyadhense TaxID=486698 RepID=A0A1X2CC47_9MYCO|nr:class I SAM-dependent methyltransferase [Mycobacterium riyadhense]ORW73517.1 SAM-dependent methyltransferase [Mycobacterium riyadhense]
MTRPDRMDWDAVYRQDAPPPWSIGAPQPELAALIDQGKVRSDVLDAGCGHAALSLALATRGYAVVGLDASPAAISAATAAAAKQELKTASFAVADVTSFSGYDCRFSTIFDSGLFHSLPVERRHDYLKSIHRAAAPGARLFILAFATHAFAAESQGPNGFTESELRETVSQFWAVDDIRPATLYANEIQMSEGPMPFANVERDDEGHMKLPGFLLSAHRAEQRNFEVSR